MSRKRTRAKAALPSLGSPEVQIAAPPTPCVTAELRALLQRAACCFTGPAARAAAYEHQRAHFSEHSFNEYTNLEAVSRALAMRFTNQLAAQQQWSAVVVPSAVASHRLTHADDSALMVLAYAEAAPPVLCTLETLRWALSSGHRLWSANRQRTLAECSNVLSPVLVSAFEEFKRGLEDAQFFAAQAELLLARLRVDGCIRDYIAAADSILAACEAFATASADAFAERSKWSAEAVQLGVATAPMGFHDGCQVRTFFTHEHAGAAFAGNLAAAGSGTLAA
jgi:hypothetical protein